MIAAFGEGEARGRQEGREEGFLAGRIVLLQELLGIRPSTEIGRASCRERVSGLV